MFAELVVAELVVVEPVAEKQVAGQVAEPVAGQVAEPVAGQVAELPVAEEIIVATNLSVVLHNYHPENF